ncbi:hypothetical protein KUTeg_016975 [Tegillarca granosa]|uniref:Polycomb group protein ASXL2 n=1 Tax=Tegillarca granosa TaxID=220873 RepID=A0ABQ9ES69_TEGGR|nr:hypothetical protein KUTeg_016975 [Tegillarca granosa]
MILTEYAIFSTMQSDISKDKHSKKKRSRTWAEAAKIVLEKNSQTPMSYKAILKAIQDENLKDISGSVPLACLNSCLHAYSRSKDSLFYKVAGRSGVYGLMSDRPEGSVLLELPEDSTDEDGSEKPFKEKRKENVMYVKLPPWVKTIPPTDEEEQNGQNGCEDASSSTAASTRIKTVVDRPTFSSNLRRSLRQSLRQKKKRPDFPRIIIKPIPPPPPEQTKGSESSKDSKDSEKSNEETKTQNGSQSSDSSESTRSKSPLSSVTASKKPQTMRELLACIPGFSMKPRKRNRKLSHAAQIAQTKEGCIDLETPDSILIKVNLRALINKQTFSLLPQQYQYKLMHLLPECDRYVGSDGALRFSTTALNNEFFAKSCEEWTQRLAEGEFTPENQLRLKQDEEKDQIKLDPWKTKHFEPVYGKKVCVLSVLNYEVPKADLPSPEIQDPPVVKAKPQVKRPTLVSTMLRQRSISTVVGTGLNVSSASGITQSNLLLQVDKTALSTHSEESHKVLKRTLSNDEINVDDVSPVKRQKSPLTSQEKHIEVSKSVGQLQSEEMLNASKTVFISQPSVTTAPRQVSLLNPITTSALSATIIQRQSASVPSSTGALQAALSQGIKPVTLTGTPGIVRSPPHARTLAQIKVQTNAARLQGQGQGQTRTLAQIKAQTKAKVQMRGQAHQQPMNTVTKLQAHLAKTQAPAVSTTSNTVRHLPNIILPQPARLKQSQKEKESSPEGDDDSDTATGEVNLKRSMEICQKVMEKSRTMNTMMKPGEGQVSVTVSSGAHVPGSNNNCLANTLVQSNSVTTNNNQSQLSASKLLFSNSSTSVKNNSAISSVNSNVSGSQTVEATGQIFTKDGTPLKIITVPQISAPNISSTGAVLTVPGTNAKFIIPSGVPNTTVSSPNIVQILHGTNANTTRVQPMRAASAPPQNNVSHITVQNIIRSASVGGNMTESSNEQNNSVEQNNSDEIIVNMTAEQLNFLSKSGTVTAPGREGSLQSVFQNKSKYVQRPETTSVQQQQSGYVTSTENLSPNKRVQKIVVCSAAQYGSNQLPLKETQVGSGSKVVLSRPNSMPGITTFTSSLKDANRIIVPSSVLTSAVNAGLTNSSNQSNCMCSLKAMIMCRKCGAFCHDDCIGPSKLCVTCLIPTQ